MWITPPALGCCSSCLHHQKGRNWPFKYDWLHFLIPLFVYFSPSRFFKIKIYTHTHTPRSAAAAPSATRKSCSVKFPWDDPPELPVCPQGGQSPVPSPAQGLPPPIICSRGWHVVTWLCLTCHVTLRDNDLEICANHCFDCSPRMSGFGLVLFFSFFFILFFFSSRMSCT